MDAQHTFSVAPIHMSLSDVCCANPLNPSQRRRSKKASHCVSQFPPAVTAKGLCALRGRRTELPWIVLRFLSSSCADRADAAFVMTCPGERCLQAALIFLSIAQMTTGTVGETDGGAAVT